MFYIFLLLGVFTLCGLFYFMRWYAEAQPSSVVSFLKWLALSAIGFLTVFLFISGRFGWTVMTLPVLLPMFLRLRNLMHTYKVFSKMSGMRGKSNSEEISNVETSTIRMYLNQRTGEMTGEVLKGPKIGKKVEKLSQKELLEVLIYCQKHDDEGAQLLETYLDRLDLNWRENGPNYQENKSFEGSSKMDRKEALEVLGLADDATETQIKSAYHKLISQLHPDKGGSSYLAAKINQARECLLEK